MHKQLCQVSHQHMTRLKASSAWPEHVLSEVISVPFGKSSLQWQHTAIKALAHHTSDSITSGLGLFLGSA